ncbi:MAG TPA: hypothetical protein QF716_01280 [Candidatus Thalassarchaeaceae archaeon]|jgi:hypothetical protein|nr:hypothetical protein [Candidatus Thalassarchaeaceae archaeon]HJM67493.1 hypothetical protein [Candidatus Thalassarchaeaceae archaeon]
MSLLDLPAFATAAPVLREAALKLRTSKSSLTIVAPLDESGIFASALLEAALLDAGIPYQRRLRDNAKAAKGPSIVIDSTSVSQLESIGTEPLSIHLAPLEVEALVASGGDSRHGLLSPVALAAGLGNSIAPSGAMSRLLMPWILTGNWLSSGLEHTYDPVYTVLRDYLSNEGHIRVVPMPEVPDVHPDSLPGIDSLALGAVRDRWGQLDLEGRAQSLSHLMKPLLDVELPSTARLEELGWHRIMAAGWERDLASQLTSFTKSWRDNPSGRRSQASDTIDSLLRTGQMP